MITVKNKVVIVVPVTAEAVAARSFYEYALFDYCGGMGKSTLS
jgi:hypothetical protein